jgi:[NiFe] hydrogenase diaphorase moiety large subunit
VSVNHLLDMVGAKDAKAVQVGGPSGNCVAPKDFGRRICFEDLPTGGSIMVFGQNRDILEVVRDFTEFFVDESCGWCAPCRVGTTVLLRTLDRIIAGQGGQADVDQLTELANTVKACSRCGLGQTAANPFLTSLQNMPEIYREKLREEDYVPTFRLEDAVAYSEEFTGRKSEAREAE